MVVGEREGLGEGDSGAENHIRHWVGSYSRDKSVVTLEYAVTVEQKERGKVAGNDIEEGISIQRPIQREEENSP